MMIIYAVLLAMLVSANELGYESLVDGVITVKVSNTSGYDLWFPDGSYKYTPELKANYICNGAWYSSPYKPLEKEFNVKGFVFVMILGILITFVLSASFPMIYLSTAQNKFSIELGDKAQQESSRLASNHPEKITPAVEAAMEPEETSFVCLELFSKIWMLVGCIAMFFIACICSNCFMIINGWPSTVYEKEHGWCYKLDKRNMLYDEDSTVKPLADDDESSNTTSDYSTATVRIDHTGSVTFVSKCGTAFFRPTEGSNITWRLESPNKRKCVSVNMRRMRGHTTNVWYGQDDSGRNEGVDLTKGGKCPYEYVKDKKEYPVRFHSCCTQGYGYPVDDDCTDNGKFFGDFECVPDAFAGDTFQCIYRVKTYEFDVEEMAGWEKCEHVKDYKGYRLYRNDEDVTNEYFINAVEDNSDVGLYPFGWLTADAGSQVIALDQSNIAGDGLGFALYWGNLSNEDWLKTHINMGPVDKSWKDPLTMVPAFKPLSAVPPFSKGCTMTFTTKKDISDLAEFRVYCPSVKARMNNYGNVVITTDSEETCSVIVKGTVLDNNIETVLSINAYSPVSIHLENDMSWRCSTLDDEAMGEKCGMTADWSDFTPENYSVDYFYMHQTTFSGEPGQPGVPASSDPFSNVKDIFKYVGITLAAIGGAILVGLVGFKLLSLTACCVTRCPSCSLCGRSLCSFGRNRHMYPQQHTKVEINLNNISEDENSSK